MKIDQNTTFQCRRCGACCRIKNGIVRVSDEEIRRIAAFLGKEESSFIAEYSEFAPDRRGLVLKSRPTGASAWLHKNIHRAVAMLAPEPWQPVHFIR